MFKVSRMDDLGSIIPFGRNGALDSLHIISAEVAGANLLPLESPSWLRVTAGCRQEVIFWEHQERVLIPLWAAASVKLPDANSCWGSVSLSS